MPITVGCQTCGARLKAPDGSVGRVVKCPKCAASLTIPDSTARGREPDPPTPPALPPPRVSALGVRPPAPEHEEDTLPPRSSRRRSRRDDDEDDRRPRRVVHHHYHTEKSGGTAAVLEILPGLLIQTFGIGHMYAGNVGVGLLFMFGYWVLLGINIVLLYFCIGIVTLPLCWVGALVLSPILAASSCRSR